MIDEQLAPVSSPNDPYRRPMQTWPRLSEAMIARAVPYGTVAQVARGELLFARGEKYSDFFVVLSGAIEILHFDERGDSHVLTVHGAREFTGELDLLSGNRNLVTARVRDDACVLRIERAAFTAMTSAEADIGEVVMRALILRRMGIVEHGQAGVVLVGSRHMADVLRIRRFLLRNNYPHHLLDVDLEAEAMQLLHALDLAPRELPAVIAPGLPPLRNPTLAALSDALGLTECVDETLVQDVTIVGAGPAGLATAVYAASEGLRTLVIEGLAPGGQAGTSSRIENYLGFPTGISGHALASRAQVQAQKFGVNLLISRIAQRLRCEPEGFVIELDDGRHVVSRSVVVATGARYRRLDIRDYARYEGQGIHYAATPMEAQLCGEQQVIVVGGGNSAGQAAVYLSRVARHVHMVVRGHSLAETMSDYLVRRIDRSPSITLHTRTEIAELSGEASLSRVTCRHRDSGAMREHDVCNLFVMIGAEPNTGWLGDRVLTDQHGFVCTGSEGTGRLRASAYETSLPGIFAVGDVRSGSVKRVAASVGEGSVVVHAIHKHLGAGAA